MSWAHSHSVLGHSPWGSPTALPWDYPMERPTEPGTKTWPWSWNWILLEADLQKKPQPQPHSLTATIWETWDISSAQILDPKQWSNKCLLTYYVQSNVLQSNKIEYTMALYLCSRCVTLDPDSQNVLSNERREKACGLIR